MKRIGFIVVIIIVIILSCSDHNREMGLLLNDSQLSEELCFDIISSRECQNYFNIGVDGVGSALCGWACCMLCTENSAVADLIC